MVGRQEQDFGLALLVEDAEVILRNVFFESGSAALSAESEPELREVSAWLADNPGIRRNRRAHR